MSRFIAFEGIDGAGKSTQIKLLSARLGKEGIPHIITREPGGCEIAERIRGILLDSDDMCPEAEALLFAAARAQHVREIIRPALAEGKTVLADRYIHSSIAYQGYGRGLGQAAVMRINEMAMEALWPDRVFFLDISPERSIERRHGTDPDRMETGDAAWLELLRRGYLDCAAHDNRIAVLDGDQGVEYLQDAIWDIWMEDSEDGDA